MKKLLSAIWSIISGFIFGKGPGIIKPDGPSVVRTYLEVNGGKKFLVTVYSDGSTVRKPYNEDDPTGVSDFVDGLGN